ncbi:MAG: LacI family DNA-binding transcriptional regulator [Sphaerochaetaceae bacterium]
MVSLKDVAKIAGVSPSTVSRVINRTVFVSDETRLKVEKAIAQVNYRPNLLAQSLRLKVTRNIGLLVPEIAHPAFSLMIDCIEQSASQRGLNLLIFNTHSDTKREAEAIDMLLGQNINGIIFCRVSDESYVDDLSRSYSIPMVVIDRAYHNEKIPNVTLDNYQAGALAARHLVEVGCRKIATITGNFKINLARDRHAGFTETLDKLGVKFDERLLWQGIFSYESGIDGTNYFIDNGLEFDGLWGQNDMVAAGALMTMVRRGIRVPQDVAVMGMDDVHFAAIYNPPLTTISQPYDQLCDKAVDYIDKLTSGEAIEQHQVILPPTLVVRESTRRSSNEPL